MTSILNGAHDVNANSISVVSARNYFNLRENPSTGFLRDLETHIAAGAMHDSSERRDAPKCHPETRVAVQEEIHSWVVDGDTEEHPTKLKWVTGPAGTGKTAIAGSLTDRFSKEGLLAGCFFFWSSSSSPRQRTKTALIPTLAYQLAQKHDALKEAIAGAVERNPLVFKKTLRVQMETLILQPLRTFGPQLDWSRLPKVILIDGLDECEAENIESAANPPPRGGSSQKWSKEDDQLEILQALLEASSDPAFPFRILVASRPERVIRSFFQPDDGSTSPFSSTLVLDEKYSPDADITLFLEAKLNEIRRKHKLGSTWPPENAVPILVKKASGQFIYAATVIRFLLESQRSGNLHTLLDVALNLKPTNAETNPFAHLDALYSRILSSSPNPTLAVHWMWVVKKKLSSQSHPAVFVNQWLETFPGQAEHILGDLHSLIKVPPSNDTKTAYDFYHKSLFDYLDDSGRSGRLYIDGPDRERFFTANYFEVVLSRGHTVSNFGHMSREHFLACYFRVWMGFLETFKPNQFKQVTLQDATWWVREGLPRQNDKSVDEVCRKVHDRCRWYRCSRACTLWRGASRLACEQLIASFESSGSSPYSREGDVASRARARLEILNTPEVPLTKRIWKRIRR